jgi:hypothetical protein
MPFTVLMVQTVAITPRKERTFTKTSFAAAGPRRSIAKYDARSAASAFPRDTLQLVVRDEPATAEAHSFDFVFVAESGEMPLADAEKRRGRLDTPGLTGHMLRKLLGRAGECGGLCAHIVSSRLKVRGSYQNRRQLLRELNRD